ncbi:MAG: hypothetical protein GY820_38485 [Gammaproteobacteria bacterium]|nr:hypothetical protein [Gammaproteobacteria bacterium]
MTPHNRIINILPNTAGWKYIRQSVDDGHYYLEEVEFWVLLGSRENSDDSEEYPYFIPYALDGEGAGYDVTEDIGFIKLWHPGWEQNNKITNLSKYELKNRGVSPTSPEKKQWTK